MRAATKVSNSPSAKAPERWWQWVLLYPALGISMLSAAPDWIDKARATWSGVNSESLVDAKKQSELWRRNLTCAASPYSWYNNPSNVKVDATICDSGDIFVRASTPANGQFFKWIPLEEVVEAPGTKGNSVVPSANAAPATPLPLPLRLTGNNGASGAITRVQYQSVVICQRFLDQRMLLRHVRTPQGCFDEIVDTFNGMITKRMPVPCRGQC